MTGSGGGGVTAGRAGAWCPVCPDIRKPDGSEVSFRPETGRPSRLIVRKPDVRPARVDNLVRTSLRLVFDPPTPGGVTVRRTTPPRSSLVSLRPPDTDTHNPLGEGPVISWRFLAECFSQDDTDIRRLETWRADDVAGRCLKSGRHVRVRARLAECAVGAETSGHDTAAEQGSPDSGRVTPAAAAGARPDVAVTASIRLRDAEALVTTGGASRLVVGAVRAGIAEMRGDVLAAALPRREAGGADHPAKPLLAYGVAARSNGIMSTLLDGSEAGPVGSWSGRPAPAALGGGSSGLAGLGRVVAACDFPAVLTRPRFDGRAPPDLPHLQYRIGLREVPARRELSDALAADAEHLADFVAAHNGWWCVCHVGKCTERLTTLHLPSTVGVIKQLARPGFTTAAGHGGGNVARDPGVPSGHQTPRVEVEGGGRGRRARRRQSAAPGDR